MKHLSGASLAQLWKNTGQKSTRYYTSTQVMPEGSAAEPVCHSTLTSYLPNSPAVYRKRTDTGKKTILTSLYNQPVVNLYLRCYQHLQLERSRLLLLVANRQHYLFDPAAQDRNSWVRQHTFCYECSLPVEMPDQQQKEQMIRELDHFFQLEGRIEQQQVSSLVLYNCTAPAPVAPPSEATEGLQAFTVYELVHRLNHLLYNQPVFDETTGGFQTILLEQAALTQLPLLNYRLSAYGLHLRAETRVTDLFVLREKHPLPA